jgi:serine/threonine protein phosphatase PrpC
MRVARSGGRVGAASDTGNLRDRNEDRYWADQSLGAYLVADGVGGHASGDLAAQTAVEAIREIVSAGGRPAEDLARAAIAEANNRIFAIGGRNGMACVLTLALVEGCQVTVGHVGDSRLYLVWKGGIRKITPDHSLVGEIEDAGSLSETQAMRHPRRHEVLRDVGTRRRSAGEDGFIDIRTCRFHRRAALLLCSDGLSDHLTSAEIREIAERYSGSADEVAQELVEAANARGGRDNITAVFVAGPEFSAPGSRTRPRLGVTQVRRRIRWRLRWALLIAGALLGALMWVVMR